MVRPTWLDQQEDTGTLVARQRGSSAARDGVSLAVDPDQLSDLRWRLGSLGECIAGWQRDETEVAAGLWEA